MSAPQPKPNKPSMLQLALETAKAEKAAQSAYSQSDWRPGADVPLMYEPSVADPGSAVGGALTNLKDTVQRWLHVPDTALVELTAGHYIANMIAGPPVWLQIIGGSSDGKGEQVQPIAKRPKVWSVSTITEASLLSGTSEHDKIRTATGGTLRQVGDLGILFFKDFTSVLAMNRERLDASLAALREIYDCKWDRPVGTDGGIPLHWDGKCGIISCVTAAIDSHQKVINEMGPRFLHYRCLETDGHAQGRRAISRTGKELAEMQEDLELAMEGLIEAVDLEAEPPKLSPQTEDWILALAEVVVRGRTSVERDKEHEITNKGIPETPARLIGQLKQFCFGLTMAGLSSGRIRQLITKIAFDCLPPIRREILDKLQELGPSTALELTNALEGYSLSAMKRYIEDIAIHKLICRPDGHKWQIMDYFQECYMGIYE